MKPAAWTISVMRGDNFGFDVVFTDDAGTPINITGYTYTAQIRASPDDVTVLATMTATVNGPAGKVALDIPAATTATLIPGRRVWDLQETAAGIVTTMLAGPADVLADVTRSGP